MKKTATEVEKTIKKHFPKLKYIWLLDKEYELPTLAELEEMIEERLNSPAAKKLFELMASSDDYDCDDRTLQLRAMIKARRPRWPMPECIGFLKELIETVHSRFLCDTEEGLKVIEGEGGSIFDPDLKDYEVFAVWG